MQRDQSQRDKGSEIGSLLFTLLEMEVSRTSPFLVTWIAVVVCDVVTRVTFTTPSHTLNCANNKPFRPIKWHDFLPISPFFLKNYYFGRKNYMHAFKGAVVTSSE